MVVRQVVRRFVGGGSNRLALHVDALNGGFDKAGPSERGTDWLRAVPQFQPSGARFEQQWCNDEEVLATHERDLDVPAAAQKPLEGTRRGHAPESTAQHDNTHGAAIVHGTE